MEAKKLSPSQWATERIVGINYYTYRAQKQELVFSCYTDFVLRNITITVSEDAALWARRKAAEENTSVSKLVGRMLEEQMRTSDEYWRAHRQWKKLPLMDIDAAGRLSRDEAHARR